MKQVIFLKAVNVSGSKKVNSKDLARLLNGVAGGTVTPVLNTGNFVVDGPLEKPEVEATAAKLVEETYGFSIDVVVFNWQDLRKTFDGYPFHGEDRNDSWKLVYFFEGTIAAEKLAAMEPWSQPELFDAREKWLYLYYPNGIGRSKVTTNYLDKKLGIRCTGRNIKTIAKILGL